MFKKEPPSHDRQTTIMKRTQRKEAEWLILFISILFFEFFLREEQEIFTLFVAPRGILVGNGINTISITSFIVVAGKPSRNNHFSITIDNMGDTFFLGTLQAHKNTKNREGDNNLFHDLSSLDHCPFIFVNI